MVLRLNIEVLFDFHDLRFARVSRSLGFITRWANNFERKVFCNSQSLILPHWTRTFVCPSRHRIHPPPPPKWSTRGVVSSVFLSRSSLASCPFESSCLPWMASVSRLRKGLVPHLVPQGQVSELFGVGTRGGARRSPRPSPSKTPKTILILASRDHCTGIVGKILAWGRNIEFCCGISPLAVNAKE